MDPDPKIIESYIINFNAFHAHEFTKFFNSLDVLSKEKSFSNLYNLNYIVVSKLANHFNV